MDPSIFSRKILARHLVPNSRRSLFTIIIIKPLPIFHQLPFDPQVTLALNLTRFPRAKSDCLKKSLSFVTLHSYKKLKSYQNATTCHNLALWFTLLVLPSPPPANKMLASLLALCQSGCINGKVKQIAYSKARAIQQFIIQFC